MIQPGFISASEPENSNKKPRIKTKFIKFSKFLFNLNFVLGFFVSTKQNNCELFVCVADKCTRIKIIKYKYTEKRENFVINKRTKSTKLRNLNFLFTKTHIQCQIGKPVECDHSFV